MHFACCSTEATIRLCEIASEQSSAALRHSLSHLSGGVEEAAGHQSLALAHERGWGWR